MNTFLLNNKEYSKEWLQLDQIYYDNQDWVKIICCIGDNSIGKTYSVENLFIQEMDKGNDCVWIRWSKESAKKCVNGWKQVLRRFDKQGDYKVDDSGIYRYVSKSKKDANGEPLPVNYLSKKTNKFDIDLKQVCAFIYLSSLDNSISSFSEKVKFFCIDEILQGNEGRVVNMKHPYRAIKNMMKRLCRNMIDYKPVLFMLGNPWSFENDILADLGIEYDWNLIYNLKDDIEVDLFRGIIKLAFPDSSSWENDRLKEQHAYFDTIKDEMDYEYQNPNLKRVIAAPIDAIPLLNFTIGGYDNTLTIYKAKYNNKPIIYIDIMKPETSNLKCYCFNIKDCWGSCYFLSEPDNIWSIFSFIWSYKLSNDAIYYFSPYCRKWTNELIAIIELNRRVSDSKN